MHVFHGFDEVILQPGPKGSSAVITMGNFDGVHLGHQSLLNEVKKKARELGCLAGVVTFEPHPVKILYPERGLKEIYTLKEVLQALEGCEMDFVVVQPFDFAFSQLPPRGFVRQMAQHLRIAHVVVGHDFSFGFQRQGDAATLLELGREFDFTVSQVAPLLFEGEPISSSRIREALAKGDVAAVRRLLGRPFALRGQVVKGQARGRRLGFPTANIATAAEIVPRTGVYVTRLTVDGNPFPAVTNVGFNPTFTSDSSLQHMTIETHLLNVQEDLYGFEVRLEFLERLRDEIKFENADSLIKQIKLDVQAAESFFGGGPC